MLNSVRSKFAAITILGVGAVVCVGLLALKEKVSLAKTLEVVLIDSQAMGHHKEADMMHDALRSDVLASFVASTPADSATAEADLKEHAQWFRNCIEANTKADLAPEIRSALQDVQGPLKEYIESAEVIVALAKTDKPAAQAKYPAFKDAFETLEGKMESVSELIETHAAKAADTPMRARRTRPPSSRQRFSPRLASPHCSRGCWPEASSTLSRRSSRASPRFNGPTTSHCAWT
jgi:methyl-accepting chemotaxis protein